MDTTFLMSQSKKEGAIEFVRVMQMLKVFENMQLSSCYVYFLSKHLKSTIYYKEAKLQQSGRFLNVTVLSCLSTLLVIIILLFPFTIWYERRRKLKIERKQLRIRQVHLDCEKWKSMYYNTAKALPKM